MSAKKGRRTAARSGKHQCLIAEGRRKTQKETSFPTVAVDPPIGRTVDVSEDALVQAIQMVIIKRSRLLAEEVVQSALDALRGLDAPVLTAGIRSTERAGMRGYASSTRHKKGK
jgi:hypothetical protein